MLSNLFLGMSLLGAEWVLYLLVLLSVTSVSLIFERLSFYRKATQGLSLFRSQLRAAILDRRWEEALQLSKKRVAAQNGPVDLETGLSLALLERLPQARQQKTALQPEVLSELAQDHVVRTKIAWDKNLAALATIGNNAPFVGLFGTVLGIIKAFHDLSKQAGQGVTGVTAGVSEALVATAVGILVAIPAVVAFNFFQRRVRAALSQAEAMKSFLVGHLASTIPSEE